MKNEFLEIMSKRTDEELVKIVTIDREGYQKLAIEAADEEIKKRGIDTSKLDEVKASLTIKLEEQKIFDAKKVSSWTRLIHHIVDSIAFFILASISILILALFLDLFIDTKNNLLIELMSYLLFCLFFIASFFAYYIYMEYKFQKTLGKFITKTKVVTKDGQKPKLSDIARRTFCRLIPLDNFSFLFTKNGFHDYLSNTTVIKDKA